jgi:hypothetical protein
VPHPHRDARDVAEARRRPRDKQHPAFVRAEDKQPVVGVSSPISVQGGPRDPPTARLTNDGDGGPTVRLIQVKMVMAALRYGLQPWGETDN